MNYREQYQIWRNEPSMPADMKQRLAAMEADEQEIKGCFGAELQFGTAGIRGIMDVGTNRLNVFTVRRTAQGLAAWLCGTDLPKKCAIAYDSRHNSRYYAELCAAALAEKNIHVYIYHELAPTPMLSYAVRQLGCGCGIVVSASHNAGIYNGIKCYGADGCQMTDEPAKIVFDEISSIPYFRPAEKDFDTLKAEGIITDIPMELWNRYYDRVMQEGMRLDMVPNAKLNVVYTPLCGTGNKPVREMMRRLGVNTTVVKVQENPDGDFKTCEYPNPETDAALNESYKVAQEVPCDLILGTDPDCDRVAIAVPVDGGFQKLTGNELGCLLLDYILQTRSERGDLPKGAFSVRSIVSSALADKICAKYGCEMHAVLTGFKWIGGEILSYEQRGEEDKFVFGFEESCGYLKGTYARDKDAVVASMLVCEMAAFYKTKGMNLVDAMNALYKEYGYYMAKVQSIELSGADAMEKAAALMAGIRSNCPENIGGYPVTAVLDYKSGTKTDTATGAVTEITLPRSNVVELQLGESGKVIARPSGTEPKVKFYYTAIGACVNCAGKIMSKLVEGMKSFIPE